MDRSGLMKFFNSTAAAKRPSTNNQKVIQKERPPSVQVESKTELPEEPTALEILPASYIRTATTGQTSVPILEFDAKRGINIITRAWNSPILSLDALTNIDIDKIRDNLSASSSLAQGTESSLLPHTRPSLLERGKIVTQLKMDQHTAEEIAALEHDRRRSMQKYAEDTKSEAQRLLNDQIQDLKQQEEQEDSLSQSDRSEQEIDDQLDSDKSEAQVTHPTRDSTAATNDNRETQQDGDSSDPDEEVIEVKKISSPPRNSPTKSSSTPGIPPPQTGIQQVTPIPPPMYNHHLGVQSGLFGAFHVPPPPPPPFPQWVQILTPPVPPSTASEGAESLARQEERQQEQHVANYVQYSKGLEKVAQHQVQELLSLDPHKKHPTPGLSGIAEEKEEKDDPRLEILMSQVSNILQICKDMKKVTGSQSDGLMKVIGLIGKRETTYKRIVSSLDTNETNHRTTQELITTLAGEILQVHNRLDNLTSSVNALTEEIRRLSGTDRCPSAAHPSQPTPQSTPTSDIDPIFRYKPLAISLENAIAGFSNEEREVYEGVVANYLQVTKNEQVPGYPVNLAACCAVKGGPVWGLADLMPALGSRFQRERIRLGEKFVVSRMKDLGVKLQSFVQGALQSNVSDVDSGHAYKATRTNIPSPVVAPTTEVTPSPGTSGAQQIRFTSTTATTSSGGSGGAWGTKVIDAKELKF